MLHKIIYSIGSRLRNPALKKTYLSLKKTESYSFEDLQKIQNEKFIRLYEWASTKSEFYKKLYLDNAIFEGNIMGLQDIVKLPIVDKKTILQNSSQIQIKEMRQRLVYSETSGSTGEPLVFYRNEKWDSATRAAQLRGYSWYGVKPWEKNGYFWGFNFSISSKIKVRFYDFLMNRYRIFKYNKKSIDRFAKKVKKYTYIEGYSSMIYEVAKIVNQRDIRVDNLKMVKGTSEKIYESYQTDAVKAFGKKIISEYGSAETGIIAFECPYGNMHVTMENVYVEVIDNEIVVTNLESFSFPIIRYKLGDYVEIDVNKKCDCGMKHQIIDSVLGRVGKSIEGNTQKFPSLTLYYVFKNIAIHNKIVINYQVVQKKIGEVLLYLSRDIGQDEYDIIMKEFFKYFKDDLKVSYCGLISDDYNQSKKKDFISLLEDINNDTEHKKS